MRLPSLIKIMLAQPSYTSFQVPTDYTGMANEVLLFEEAMERCTKIYNHYRKEKCPVDFIATGKREMQWWHPQYKQHVTSDVFVINITNSIIKNFKPDFTARNSPR